MTPSGPQTRASFAQEIQAEVRALPPAQRDAVIARCGDAWDAIARALPTSWLPAATYIPLNEAVRAALGDDDARALYRRTGRRIVKNPMLLATVEAMIRLLGVSPHSLFKFTPRARDQMVRDAGTLTYERVGERSAMLRLRGAPRETFLTGTTTLMLSGTFLGVIDACGEGAHAVCDVTNLALDRGDCDFVLRW